MFMHKPWPQWKSGWSFLLPIRIYGRMRKVMWRASSWRLFCWSAAFMHEKMWLCHCWCPGKDEKPDHVGDSRMELFPVKDPRDMLYSVHIYIMTDGEKWKKHYICWRGWRQGRRCLSSACSMTLWARGIIELAKKRKTMSPYLPRFWKDLLQCDSFYFRFIFGLFCHPPPTSSAVFENGSLKSYVFLKNWGKYTSERIVTKNETF